ncbi:MAG: flagellin, partial [Pseudomonadales bacterium]|nr:flagellin [Pseudomonadales bacterium]
SVSASNLLKTLEDGGLSDLSVASSSQANTAISSIDSALESINSVASEFGAVTNRFESTIENLSQARENTAAANSRIADADIAAEATDLIRRQIGNQVDIAIQAQANSNQKNVLSLLSGL